MEASGATSGGRSCNCGRSAISCALTDPRGVRRYAEALGLLEKTDRIDAYVIARFADTKNLVPTPLPSPAQQRLKALVTRLRQATDDLTVQKQRRASLLDNPEMRTSLDEVIALLKRQSRSPGSHLAMRSDVSPQAGRGQLNPGPGRFNQNSSRARCVLTI